MKDRAWSMENAHRFKLEEPEIEQIRNLYMNNHLSDVLFLFPVKDNHSEFITNENSTAMSLPAHRLILFLRSGSFRKALEDNSTSYTNTAHGEKRLRLPLKMIIQDTSYKIFKELLRYIYTGTLQPPQETFSETASTNPKQSTLFKFWLELLQAATRFDVPSLSILCIQEIESLLPHHPSIAIDILYLVDSNCFKEVKSNSVQQAVQTLVALCTSEILSMPDSEMQEILQTSQCSTDRLLKLYHEKSQVPLVLAINHQNFRVVDALLNTSDRNQILELPDEDGVLPLVAAMISGNDAMIRRVLVPSNVNWVVLSNSVCGWFLMACASGNVMHCKILVESHGADVNAISTVTGSDDFGKSQTPLHVTSRFGSVDVIRYLLSLNAVPNFQDEDGNTPLHYANNQFVAEVLLTQSGKCNPNIPNARGQVPLHLAARRGDIGVVGLLLQNGADLSSTDEEGQTAFHTAAANGHASVCLILIKMQEDQKMKADEAPHASSNGPDTSNEFKSQFDFDINAVDYKSNTALHLAAMAPQTRVEKIIQVLLENGADPNCPNWFGYTPLHLFCAHQDGPASVVEMFIEHGTLIKAQSIDGSTPLHLAVGKASESIMVALVRAGAPVNVQDVAGRSVVNLAETTSQGVMVVPLLLNVKTPPPWLTDEVVNSCSSCAESFGMATRRHHCRHCGRMLCSKCSTNRIPLPKFDQQAAARVCDICFDVLSFRKLM